MCTIEYTYRKSTFTKPETYVLEQDAIKVYNESKMLIDTVSLNNISAVTMLHTPTKTAKKMHQCTIKTKANKKLVLRNYSYLGLANFKDQTDKYLTFIYELHKNTRTKSTQFKKGINKGGFIAMLSFLILITGLMAVIAIVLFNKGKYAEMCIVVFAVLLFGYLILTSTKRYKPENYNPNDISEQLLPN